MAIIIDERNRVFTLQTKNSTYQMKADEHNVLLHSYYGRGTDVSDKSKMIYMADRGFSGNPYDLGMGERSYSLDNLPQEYSCYGTGDHRITALKVQNADGSMAAELRYVGYHVMKEKYAIPNLPAVYAENGETLVLTLEDPYTKIRVELYYGVLEELDIITRAVRIINTSETEVKLEKAASFNLDFNGGNYDLITLCGRYALERSCQREKITHGVKSIGSVRGASSHHYNPFAIICESNATETAGECYGVSFVYSGEFLMEVEQDHIEQIRMICGIQPESFRWNLKSEDDFWTPEVILSYSSHGLGKLSQNYHKVIREHVCRGEWKEKRRPVLINNWEATYFDFTGEKIAQIAKEAAELGIDLMVMDDGWFGKRDNDKSGLGDWVPNEEKLQCSLKELGERITSNGMKFGIWFEPEAVSEDSDLYRSHPEWAIQIPGRKPCLSRSELLLDFSNKDVQDYMIQKISDVLEQAPITYVKWDFNRSMCDKYSTRLKKEQQGEFMHRYILGLYRVLETLHNRFPQVLFEGCSGGGGRFDAGMLYYTPQIWCSDNTDAIDRLEIQHGTSFGYPISATGAHVSAVPNHQTGRVTPLSTRGCTAMAGTFGYELDIQKMSTEEKEEIKEQIIFFKKHYELIQRGNYYRLTEKTQKTCTVWEMVSEDGKEALVSAVYHNAQANCIPVRVKVHGLNPDKMYQMELCAKTEETEAKKLPYGYKKGELLEGALFEDCGIVIPTAVKNFQSWQIYISEVVL